MNFNLQWTNFQGVYHGSRPLRRPQRRHQRWGNWRALEATRQLTNCRSHHWPKWWCELVSEDCATLPIRQHKSAWYLNNCDRSSRGKRFVYCLARPNWWTTWRCGTLSRHLRTCFAYSAPIWQRRTSPEWIKSTAIVGVEISLFSAAIDAVLSTLLLRAAEQIHDWYFL